MEPTSENRPTIETAREKGRQRIDKVLNFIAPIMAPDVLLEMGKNAAKDKVDDAKERMNALKERVENRAGEIRDNLVEKVNAAHDRLTARFNAAKDRTIATAKEMTRRAKILGLTPVAKAEEYYAKVYEVPAGMREMFADYQQSRVEQKIEKARKIMESAGALAEKRDENLSKAKDRREAAARKTSVRTALAGLRTTG